MSRFPARLRRPAVLFTAGAVLLLALAIAVAVTLTSRPQVVSATGEPTAKLAVGYASARTTGATARRMPRKRRA